MHSSLFCHNTSDEGVPCVSLARKYYIRLRVTNTLSYYITVKNIAQTPNCTEGLNFYRRH
jgi:hypothetical protein